MESSFVGLTQYARTLRVRWRLIMACVILGVGGAALAVSRQTPIYQASSQLFVSTTDQTTVSGLLQSGSLASERVQSYIQFVDSPRVTTIVARALGLPPDGLGATITATSPTNTVLIDISVTSTSPQRAQAVANATGPAFAQVIAQIESPASAKSSPVKLSTVRSADLPRSPVSPKKKLDLALGLLLGLLVGVGGAVLRETLDTSVKHPADVEDAVRAPTLGMVAFDPDTDKRPLVMQSAPKSQHAESFRQLRTNLRFVNIDDRPSSLVITSSVAGEGKSVTALNLALAMSEAGLRTLLLDGDLRKPRIATYLGLEGAAGLTTLLTRQATSAEVIQTWGSRLAVLPAGAIPPNPAELLGSQQMASLLRSLEEHYDQIVIDAPPLLPVTDAAVLAAVAGGALIVVRHGKTSRDQLHRAVESLRNVDARVLGSVLNMAPAKGPDAYYTSSYYGESAPARGSGRRSSPDTAGVRSAAPPVGSANGNGQIPQTFTPGRRTPASRE